jgi:hypothetical protein
LKEYDLFKENKLMSCSIYTVMFLQDKMLRHVNGNITFQLKAKAKAVPLHAMETFGGRGGIAPTYS